MESSPGQVTFVGHSTVLVELGGARLLTDPLLRPRTLHLRRHSAPPAPGVSEGLDAVLISHFHYDHLDLPSLRALGPGVRLIGPRGLAAFVRRVAAAEVVELGVGESADVAGVRVTAVPAVHDGRRLKRGPAVDAVGFMAEAAGARVYFAGDTDLFGAMSQLGPVDLGLIPIWGWGSSLGEGHLDPRSAAEALARIQPRVVVPIHWGTLLPALQHKRLAHFLERPPREFIRHAAEAAPAVEVRVLEPGQSTAIPGPAMSGAGAAGLP
jgi:L-ascorbate metabolism protein UlaG (beta-lactamase superfamily)